MTSVTQRQTRINLPAQYVRPCPDGTYLIRMQEKLVAGKGPWYVVVSGEQLLGPFAPVPVRPKAQCTGFLIAHISYETPYPPADTAPDDGQVSQEDLCQAVREVLSQRFSTRAYWLSILVAVCLPSVRDTLRNAVAARPMWPCTRVPEVVHRTDMLPSFVHHAQTRLDTEEKQQRWASDMAALMWSRRVFALQVQRGDDLADAVDYERVWVPNIRASPSSSSYSLGGVERLKREMASVTDIEDLFKDGRGPPCMRKLHTAIKTGDDGHVGFEKRFVYLQVMSRINDTVKEQALQTLMSSPYAQPSADKGDPCRRIAESVKKQFAPVCGMVRKHAASLCPYQHCESAPCYGRKGWVPSAFFTTRKQDKDYFAEFDGDDF